MQCDGFIIPKEDDWLHITVAFDEVLVEDTPMVEQTTFHYGEISSWYNHEVTVNERLQELI